MYILYIFFWKIRIRMRISQNKAEQLKVKNRQDYHVDKYVKK